MDDAIERMVVSVRADTQGFAKDVEAMRVTLDGALSNGAARAGRAIETALAQAVRSGKLGFKDLRRVAVAAFAEIASSAIRSGIGFVLNGLGGLIGGVTGLGAPGRATGGPVVAGRPYLVGERGPELFVPSGSGQIAPTAAPAGRDVRVTISIVAPAGMDAPQALARSGRQVARAVRRALD